MPSIPTTFQILKKFRNTGFESGIADCGVAVPGSNPAPPQPAAALHRVLPVMAQNRRLASEGRQRNQKCVKIQKYKGRKKDDLLGSLAVLDCLDL
jgi:hypothetical protein